MGGHMLKKRLIPVILVRDGLLVQSIGFKRYLPIGKPKIAIEYFNRWDVDEIMVLDISSRREDQNILLQLTEHIGRIAFVPLTVGGGIRTMSQILDLLRAGADKVSLNSHAVREPALISEAARVLGNQDIVVSVDALKTGEDTYEVFIDNGKTPTGLTPWDWAVKARDYGAGEILLNSIDRDGMKAGYDTRLIRRVADCVDIPVIALGGVGKVEDFPAAILEGHAEAVAAANIFQHIEHSTIQAKASLRRAGIDIRIDTRVRYEDKALHGGRSLQ